MPDNDRKFLRLDGVKHNPACADPFGRPCDCGAEMRAALAAVALDISEGPDAVGEELTFDVLGEYPVVLGATTIRMVRQALANQAARVAP